jgi:hypothetical protein
MKRVFVILFIILPLFVFNNCFKNHGQINYEKDGYISLFNGTDLTGWKIPEGDNGHWKVLNGVIDYDAQSESQEKLGWGDKSLQTDRVFKDYKLHIEWRFKGYSGLFKMPVILPNGDYARDTLGNILYFMKPNSDSGINLRKGHQVNIWCWSCGSGEIWASRFKSMPTEVREASVPKFHADNPVGEWNTFDITLIGNLVTVYLNGILVIKECPLIDMPYEGTRGFQHNSGQGAESIIQFRNIWVKEL